MKIVVLFRCRPENTVVVRGINKKLERFLKAYWTYNPRTQEAASRAKQPQDKRWASVSPFP